MPKNVPGMGWDGWVMKGGGVGRVGWVGHEGVGWGGMGLVMKG